ncbi:uncharacterized protein LOC115886930 [Sitophilus oryzae]|uniref:Uncharacterized protein LOC115886930 n=1 Tax=Sitophilus oryzae TaxID=7048 RepID=A0A6J2YFL1_SITOR|nr:uncharacterized protein LOC115886930 [Sitophilus oryzae]
MEISMLRLSLRDKVPNIEVWGDRTKINGCHRENNYFEMELDRAHCIAKDDRWTKKIIEWRPRHDAFRSRGRPPTRWRGDLRRIHSNWMQIARDRELWKQTREAYVQQWTWLIAG